MPDIAPQDRILSFAARKRLGRRYACGHSVCGEGICGDQGTFNWNNTLTPTEITGIYQTRHGGGKQFSQRLAFYFPRNPQSGLQQANRNKFADGVAAWKVLTPAEKLVYNKNSYGLGMSGYNLFLRQYMRS